MLIDELITTGARASSDNVVVVNCSYNFMRMAIEGLNNTDDCRAICVIINAKTNEKISKFLDSILDRDHQKIYARTFVGSIIMLEMLKNYEDVNLGFEYDKELLSSGIEAFISQDADRVKEFYIHHAPWSMDIERVVRKYGKMELNIFLSNKIDTRLQNEINNFIFSRLPYCVKVFTSADRLSSYRTTSGDMIQIPHDFTEYDMVKLNSEYAV
ncbi:MAG: hypothetical protein ACLRFL_02455 [Clostridia bacterium]